ncbi:unnamed protein product [Polarella glacialis]|uniref:Diphthine--ammonia ligase n=1 Tax=Polarella glacialis TaxID=89957 RepID=A0A813DM02_POLGL|nr:unnamed protein product [Polarella glacialis]
MSFATAPRVASLLPSATEIVGHLGLQRYLVGVSHECDLAPSLEDLNVLLASGTCIRLTTSEIDPLLLSQEEINEAVIGSLRRGESLYGIIDSAFLVAKPTVVLTQALCNVCAPSASQVTGACELMDLSVQVLNLEPHNLGDVAESFVAVSTAITGSAELGQAACTKFLADVKAVTNAVAGLVGDRPCRRCVMLEWTDPLFDGGHWVPEMLVAAGGDAGWRQTGDKSKQIEPAVLEAYDPDCIVIACCGLDLDRNIRDAQVLEKKPWFAALRCVREGRVFAADGNRYFARPGPSLVAGVAILARCMHDADSAVVAAIEATGLLPAEGVAWARASGACRPSAPVPDIEELSCWAVHAKACERGELFYIDPASGYQVFTEVSQKKRGYCCGSGCRHCAYSHANVPAADRAARIQQPAWLHQIEISTSCPSIDLLFWSGGLDSFLAYRALQREGGENACVVFITTFDAKTRLIAHSEVAVDVIVKQAKAMGVGLVGIPLQTGRSYTEQVALGLSVAAAAAGVSKLPIKRICFGDLHLEPRRQARDAELAPLVQRLWGDSVVLHYPLWRKPYEELMADLVKSGAECLLSAVPKPPPPGASGIVVGARFGPELAKQAETAGWDAFGEAGEFHTVVSTWLL